MTLDTLVRRILHTGPRRPLRRRRGGALTFTLMLAIALFELLRGPRRTRRARTFADAPLAQEVRQ